MTNIELIKEIEQFDKTPTKEIVEFEEENDAFFNPIEYAFGDEVLKRLPQILKKKYGIDITEPLKRTYIELHGKRYIELKIFGTGRRDSREVYIIGEYKIQLERDDVNRFLQSVKELGKKLQGEKFLVLVTHKTSPSVEEYIKQLGLDLVFSYELLP